MSRPRIVLADDHRLVAEGLRSLLEPDFELVEIVEDGRELIKAAKRHLPDVIVADVSMPLVNGLEAFEQLRKAGCRSKFVFLTMHKDSSYAARAINAGASAYVLKHSAPEELVAAIREAMVGRTYLAKSIAESRLVASSTRLRASESEEPLLTPRQREVLQLFAEGKTAKEVGTLLHISMRTAENHKARIMRLLGASTTAELIQYAIRHRMIGGE